MERLAEGVYFLGTVGNPQIISTYLVGEGDDFALVEPGPSNTAEETIALIKGAGVRLESVKRLFVTHVHLDHAGGAWKMMESLPNAKVMVYRGGGKHLADPKRLSQGAEMVLGPFYRLWGEIRPLPAGRIQEVSDGETFAVGSRRLKVIYTPGHSPFHMSLLETDSRTLFTGDAVGMYVRERDTLWPASPLPSFRYEESMGTIESLRSQSPRRLLIPHYGPQLDPARLFELNKKTYRSWYDLLRGEPDRLGISEVVDDIIRSDPSYSWIPGDELTKWAITMHATGFRQCLAPPSHAR
ncbi:MAG TPA: MBL fold metallo-hydrolase [Conexivisphaerales archaeon]|nr:MBL fold metallo-hydrolase [Conexivisphaerales archaeon]